MTKAAKPAPPVMQVLPLKALKPWKRNPRQRHAVDAIAKSIEAFGYLSPIIVQKRTHRILAGHGRLEALKKRGAREIAVLVADLSDDQADLYTLADNKLVELAEWDVAGVADLLKEFDRKKLAVELTGFDPREIKRLLDYVEGSNVAIDETKLAETTHECPKCGFKW